MDVLNPLGAYLQTLARYHLWATRRLLAEHIAPLPDADYRRDCGLFFKSIHGTLNHLLVVESQIWLRRFAHGESPQGVSLSAEIEPDRARLAQRLLDTAQQWVDFTRSLPAARLDAPLRYTNSKGVLMSLPFAPTLAHVFNHGTHHRGQISAALTAMGRAAPELDIVYMLQSEAAAQERQT
jgi:uncharacterized damage-inducible protein DinB